MEGVISLGRERIPVKLYSAVIEQHVQLSRCCTEATASAFNKCSSTPRRGSRSTAISVQKGFPLGEGSFVLLQDDEMDKLAPEESRDIEITRFVPAPAIPLEWYDRPYYVGPESDHESDYRGLAGRTAAAQRALRHRAMGDAGKENMPVPFAARMDT